MKHDEFLDWVMTSALAAIVTLGIIVLAVTVVSALAEMLTA